jgi:hypothetical protein
MRFYHHHVGLQRDARENIDRADPYCRLEYEWLRQHRDRYAGQYVALDGDRLVSHGTDGATVLRQAREAGVKAPFISRIEALDEPAWGG